PVTCGAMPPVSLRRRLLAAFPPVLRGAALTPAAVLLVHQLRYELAFGADAPRALAEQGHAYLSSLTPWIVLLAALALGTSLGALAQRWGRASAAARGVRRRGGVRVWLLASAALVAIFAGQELLEGWLAVGHAAGAAAVLGGGGWWALPAALLVGGLLTLALRAGTAVEDALGELMPVRLRLHARVRVALGAPRPAAPTRRMTAPLAGAAAGRAPPRVGVAPALSA
ncbi:MAG TPA: hypothetical protein VFG31_02585, partial [Conexibacter sp.]|nr:hypothetical protein [Conexibacter sp.]